jgi:putative redox protein
MTSDLRPLPGPPVNGRQVRAHLREAFRVELEVRDGRFSLVSDQGPEDGGGDAGPVPSELLFSSLASCFAMAMAWSAQKRRVVLPDLEIIVSWGYNKPERMYDDIRIEARSSLATVAPEQYEALVRLAEQVCWVTRTIQRGRPITVQAAVRE